MKTATMLWITLAIFVALGVVACVHPAIVPVVLVVPIVRWDLPLEADDDARFCVATAPGPWIDPADVLPFRCVSVGAVRFWIRAQRLAN